MATLVLTVVGSVIGGPVGGAIGATIGNYIDRNVLFAPKGRQGPRLPAPDIPTGETVLAAFEGLPLDDSVLSAPRVSVVAAGTAPGWRRAAILYSIDGGAHWNAAGATAAPGVIGRIVTLPGSAGSAIADRVHAFEVELANADMTLAGADAGALDAGANLALVGDELLQFALAEQIGAVRWRLSGLLRGRRASEAAIGGQAIGDRFVLIEAESVLSLDLPVSALGGELTIMAAGPGDVAGPVEARMAVRGTSLLPPSPIGLGWREIGDGDAAVRWLRRSRVGWRWIDWVDAPLGEEREAYRITLTHGDGRVRTIETDLPTLVVPRADRAGGVTIAVRQVGAHGESVERQIVIPDWIE